MRLKHGAVIRQVIRKSPHTFEVDGVAIEASVSAAVGSRFVGRTSSGRTSVFLVREGERVFARVGSRTYHLEILAGASLTAGHSPEPGALETPMPGRVTRVAVAPGEAVKRGQELVVVEAMKMENALLAPEDGVVASVKVKVGDMVAPGFALVVIEAAK